MRIFSIASLLLLVPVLGFSRESAYHALHTVSNEKGPAVMNHVIEVQGERGSPQPEAWRVVLDDTSARGGVREMEIMNGRVASEHTPVRSYSGTGANAVMDFQKLNLDSEGAFTIAEKEAHKSRIGFDNVSYTLRGDDDKGSPIWVLQLHEASGGVVGTISIAADSGVILHKEGFGQTVVENDIPEERMNRKNTHRDLHIGHEIDKNLHRAGGVLQKFFTGKRTIDKRFQKEY